LPWLNGWSGWAKETDKQFEHAAAGARQDEAGDIERHRLAGT
jgi:hypothetical protein